MNRLQFFSQVNADIGDGIKRPELDFLNHNLTGFVMRRRPLYYRVSQGDLQMPDNIAWKTYKDERLWWVICLINQINSPCSDLQVGMLLTIPDILDIYDFFRKYRKR